MYDVVLAKPLIWRENKKNRIDKVRKPLTFYRSIYTLRVKIIKEQNKKKKNSTCDIIILPFQYFTNTFIK